MEGITRPASTRLAAIMRDRPETVICRVEGVLRAERFAPDGRFVGLEYAYTEDELADKLAG